MCACVRVCVTCRTVGVPIFTAGRCSASNRPPLIMALICFCSAALTARGSGYGTEAQRGAERTCTCNRACVPQCACAAEDMEASRLAFGNSLSSSEQKQTFGANPNSSLTPQTAKCRSDSHNVKLRDKLKG